MMHNMVTGDKFEFEINKTLSFNQKVDDIAVEIPAKHLHHVWPGNYSHLTKILLFYLLAQF